MALKIDSAQHHRNGVSGRPYCTFRLRIREGHAWRELGAVMFAGKGALAILDNDGQAYRCEDFEDELRAYIESPEGQAAIWPFLQPANEA